MADSLIYIRDTIVAEFSSRFPNWRIDGHGGRFTVEEIPLLLGQLPRILVAITGIAEWQRGGRGEAIATLDLALYFMAADKAGTPHDSWTFGAIEETLFFLMHQTWNGLARNIPELPFQAQNLFTRTVQNLRLAVWAVPFTQQFLLKE